MPFQSEMNKKTPLGFFPRAFSEPKTLSTFGYAMRGFGMAVLAVRLVAVAISTTFAFPPTATTPVLWLRWAVGVFTLSSVIFIILKTHRASPGHRNPLSIVVQFPAVG